MGYYLVYDIGGTFVKYGVLDWEGKIISRGKVPTEREDLAAFMESLSGIAKEAMARRKIVGIAVSMAGILDVERGYAYTGGAVGAIRNYPIAEKLSCLAGGLPVTIENDAKAAILAEYWKGNLQGVKNAVAFIIGTGIGGAILADGRLLRGAHFFAGEFSYMIREEGKRETMLGAPNGLGMPGLLSKAAKRMELEKPLTGEEFFDLVRGGDREAQGCLLEYARALAIQLLNVTAVADPERIVIGGGVSAQPSLIAAIRDAYTEIAAGVSYGEIPVPEILPCRFFNDSNLIGALYAHLQRHGV